MGQAIRAGSISLSCSLPGDPAEIRERFSSSSLPPSFAPGRCTTVFTAGGAAQCGAPPFSAELRA